MALRSHRVRAGMALGGAGPFLPPLHPPLSYCLRLNSPRAPRLPAHMEAISGGRGGGRGDPDCKQLPGRCCLGVGSCCCCHHPPHPLPAPSPRLPEPIMGFSSPSELEMEVSPASWPRCPTTVQLRGTRVACPHPGDPASLFCCLCCSRPHFFPFLIAFSQVCFLTAMVSNCKRRDLD